MEPVIVTIIVRAVSVTFLVVVPVFAEGATEDLRVLDFPERAATECTAEDGVSFGRPVVFYDIHRLDWRRSIFFDEELFFGVLDSNFNEVGCDAALGGRLFNHACDEFGVFGVVHNGLFFVFVLQI